MKKGLDKKFLKILDKISRSKGESFYLKRFLAYLKRKRMQHYLPSLVKLFKKKRIEPRMVRVETARELDEQLKKELEAFIKMKIQREPIINYKVNPDLIGGFKIKSQNFLFDYSVQNYLNRFFKY